MEHNAETGAKCFFRLYFQRIDAWNAEQVRSFVQIVFAAPESLVVVFACASPATVVFSICRHVTLNFVFEIVCLLALNRN